MINLAKLKKQTLLVEAKQAHIKLLTDVRNDIKATRNEIVKKQTKPEPLWFMV